MGDAGMVALGHRQSFWWVSHWYNYQMQIKCQQQVKNVHEDTNDAAGTTQVHDAPSVGVARTGSDGC